MNGYMFGFEVYQGKEPSDCIQSEEGSEFENGNEEGSVQINIREKRQKTLGLGTRVVLSLAKQLDLDKKNHILVFDNFYTSPELMEILAKKEIFAVGTVRSQRIGLPRQMCDSKLMKRGDIDYRLSNTSLFYLKWLDQKPVHFLSNYHGFNKSSVERKQKDGSKITVPTLSMVSDYNKQMGGVDKADMLRSFMSLTENLENFGIEYSSVLWK